MIPEWSEITIVKPSSPSQPECHNGCSGRVFIDGMEIRSVSKLEISEVIGDDDIPSVTLTIEPRMVRILLDTDFVEEDDVLVYNRPRKLIIRR